MTHFFKYVTASTGQIILENCSLRWSTPGLLNDPFDMQFALQFRINKPAARALALEKLWRHWYGPLLDRPLNKLGKVVRALRAGNKLPILSPAEFEDEFGASFEDSYNVTLQNMERVNDTIVRQLFGQDKIFCLSDTPTSVLMWSYYAQNHTGIVLRFTDQARESPLVLARPVNYVEHMPSLYSDETLSDTLAGYQGLTERHILESVVWTKSQHWSHEREWRLYSGRGRSPDPYEDVVFIRDELDGIVLGARTSEADRAMFTRLVTDNYPAAEILQAGLAPDEYRIVVEGADPRGR